jgi:pimeloyl-ACP methyl ester carboxylesterase
MYRHAFDALPRLGMRVIAVDLRGFGLSTRVQGLRYSLDAYIADVIALLDQLELDRPAIVGQSMGGGLTLHFALGHPDRASRIVLINPTSLVPLRFLPFVCATPRSVVAALGERFVPRSLVGLILRRIAYANAAAVTERDIDEYWSLTQLPGFVAAAHAVLREFNWDPVTDEAAATLAIPALVILGTHDRLIANNERVARRLHGARVRSLPGGHCVHEEDPAEAYRVIADFLVR